MIGNLEIQKDKIDENKVSEENKEATESNTNDTQEDATGFKDGDFLIQERSAWNLQNHQWSRVDREQEYQEALKKWGQAMCHCDLHFMLESIQIAFYTRFIKQGLTMDENHFRATCGPKAQDELIKKLLFEGIKKTEGSCSQ